MTGRVLSIDPGYAKRGKGSAIAYCDDAARITWIGWARPYGGRVPLCLPSDPRVVLWEVPQLDGRSYDKAPTVLELMHQGALLAGMYAEAFHAELVERTPSQWKGSQPKPQQHASVWHRLSDHERKLIGGDSTWRAIDRACEAGALDRWSKPGAAYYPKSFDTHNPLDAMALNMTYTGRLT